MTSVGLGFSVGADTTLAVEAGTGETLPRIPQSPYQATTKTRGFFVCPRGLVIPNPLTARDFTEKADFRTPDVVFHERLGKDWPTASSRRRSRSQRHGGFSPRLPMVRFSFSRGWEGGQSPDKRPPSTPSPATVPPRLASDRGERSGRCRVCAQCLGKGLLLVTWCLIFIFNPPPVSCPGEGRTLPQAATLGSCRATSSISDSPVSLSGHGLNNRTICLQPFGLTLGDTGSSKVCQIGFMIPVSPRVKK